MNKDYLYKNSGSGLERCSLDNLQWTSVFNQNIGDFVGFIVLGENVYYAASKLLPAFEQPYIDSTRKTLMRSFDNGATFQTCYQITCRELATPGDYLGSFNNSIYYAGCKFSSSFDLGETWAGLLLPNSYSSLMDVAVNYEAMVINDNETLWLYMMAKDSAWSDITGDIFADAEYKQLNCIGISGKNILTSNFFNGLWYRNDLLTGIENQESAAKLELSVFPNPSSMQATLKFKLSNPQNGTITIIDPMGRRHSLHTARFVAGENVVPIVLDSFNPGLYLIRVVAGSSSGTIKWMVK